MRSRNIKPGFFSNEELAEVDPLGRLLFAGLWLLADREGRLEDRPKRIKAELLPYDDCDVDKLLDELQDHGFIHRYVAENQRVIQIITFVKHQNPHPREAESTLPPCEQKFVECEQTRDNTGGHVKTLPRQDLGMDEAKPRQGQGKTKDMTSRAESYISESPILNPESPIPYLESRDKTEDDDDARARARGVDNFGEVVAFFEDNIHPVVSPVEADRIGSLCDDYTPEWVHHAIEEAALHRGATVAYIEATLRTWRTSESREPWLIPKKRAPSGGSKREKTEAAAEAAIERLQQRRAKSG